MQDLILGSDAGGPVGPDATQLEDAASDAGATFDSGSGDVVVDDATEEGQAADAAREEDADGFRIDAGDACASDPNWCTTHCGPGKDNCGRAVSCVTCTPKDAGCSMGACDSGDQCCTGYCGSAGTCVSTCGLSTASCTAVVGMVCCYGLMCTAGFPPVIRTCQ